MIDAYFTPVLVACGFNEAEHSAIVNNAGNAFDAVGIIIADKKISKDIVRLDAMSENKMREKLAATEPVPVPGESADSDRHLAECADWQLQDKRKPYASVVLAVQSLTPQEKAALRERVLASSKTLGRPWTPHEYFSKSFPR